MFNVSNTKTNEVPGNSHLDLCSTAPLISDICTTKKIDYNTQSALLS